MALATHLRTDLPLEALEMALWRRGQPLDGLVHHSDAGSQTRFKRSSQHPDRRGCDGKVRDVGNRADRTAAFVLTGRPTLWRREHLVVFWRAIAEGDTSEEAAARAGFSQAAGSRLFREGGGMPTIPFDEPSGRYLSFAEREEIALLRAQDLSIREVARRLGRAPSTISREVRRNAATRGGRLEHRPTVAQWHRDRRASRPKPAKLADNEQLRTYVQDQLGGQIARPDGGLVDGRDVAFKHRRHGRRQDRRWARSWSPEQIANRLPTDFPDDKDMRALYIQGRGALRRELTACLRTGRALRQPVARSRQRGKKFIPPELMISKRPPEIADRAVPGHWEGDLIIGTNPSAIGTLVERTTRFTMLLHLPPMPGHGQQPRSKNGPPLAGRGAEAVRDAITGQLHGLPPLLRRSLTWDQGAELAEHAQLKLDSDIDVWFCDPHSPWQRGTNEQTNRLLRQYFPRGTDLARHSRDDLDAVALALNTRPRKTLDWQTPAEALDNLLHSAAQAGVATTD